MRALRCKDGTVDLRSKRALCRRAARIRNEIARATGGWLGMPIQRTPDAAGLLPCLACGRRLPVGSFSKDRQRACGRAVRCKPCDYAAKEARRKRRLAEARAIAAAARPPVFPVGPLGRLPLWAGDPG